MKHTFSNFIVGPANRHAYQAAFRIANNPDATYNPLLCRAASGLGKTHLLQAISNHTKRNRASCQIVYLTPGGLGHALHNALRNDHIETLRDQYLKAEFLLVDGLQEIAGKRHSQQILLTVLDELMGKDKQIVVASTTRPQNIPSLDPRLGSRLSGSAIVDIQPPEPETCRRILRHKAAAHQVALSDGTTELILASIGANVRELENCLARLATYASLHGRSIDEALVREQLLLNPSTDEQQISAIQQTVASHFGVRISEIRTKRRTHAILVARQIAMHLSQDLTSIPLSEIGRLFGGHSTASVQRASKRIRHLAHRDAGVARSVRLLRDMLVQPRVDNSCFSFPQGDLKEMCG